jgi:transcriptional regulator with XRE-family HTH domain
MITIDQIRAGRAMARLTQAQLAAEAGISTKAMNNIENGTDAKGSTLRAIQGALERGSPLSSGSTVSCGNRQV